MNLGKAKIAGLTRRHRLLQDGDQRGRVPVHSEGRRLWLVLRRCDGAATTPWDSLALSPTPGRRTSSVVVVSSDSDRFSRRGRAMCQMSSTDRSYHESQAKMPEGRFDVDFVACRRSPEGPRRSVHFDTCLKERRGTLYPLRTSNSTTLRRRQDGRKKSLATFLTSVRPAAGGKKRLPAGRGGPGAKSDRDDRPRTRADKFVLPTVTSPSLSAIPRGSKGCFGRESNRLIRHGCFLPSMAKSGRFVYQRRPLVP